MPFIRAFFHRLRDLAGKDALERELDDELRFHLEREIEENLRRGLPAEEARAAARRSLGMPERVKEDTRLWSRLFGADPRVVGSDLELNGIVYEVVGVAPASLEDPGLSGSGFAAPKIWRATPGYFGTGSSRDGRAFTAVARLAPGVSLEAARAELETLMRGLELAYPDTNAQRTMDESWEIVGVVGDVRHFSLDRPAEPTLYLPQPQAAPMLWIDSAVVIRTSGAPEDLGAGLREAVREVDPTIAVEAVLPMARVAGDTAGQARFRTALLSAFAALALVLGVVGLYGVVAYATAGRGRELGIRMALGAERRRILALVMREGMAPAVAGAGIGLAAALALVRFLEGLLFGVEPADPATLLGATAALLAAAALACFLPARRATRIDPVETLRA